MTSAIIRCRLNDPYTVSIAEVYPHINMEEHVGIIMNGRCYIYSAIDNNPVSWLIDSNVEVLKKLRYVTSFIIHPIKKNMIARFDIIAKQIIYENSKKLLSKSKVHKHLLSNDNTSILTNGYVLVNTILLSLSGISHIDPTSINRMLKLDHNVEEGKHYNSLGDDLPSSVKDKVKRQLICWYESLADHKIDNNEHVPIHNIPHNPSLRLGEWLNDILSDDTASPVTIDMKYLVNSYNILAKICGLETVEYSPSNMHSRNALLIFDLPTVDDGNLIISSTQNNFSHIDTEKLKLILDYITSNNDHNHFTSLINNIVRELGCRS